MELPHIEHFYREMKAQGFGLLTITKDKADTVLKMVEYNGITHPIVSDTTDPATGKVFEKYHAYDGKHYLIAGDGRIVGTFSKLGISLPVLQKALAKHGIDTSTAAAVSPASAPVSESSAMPVEWKAAARAATAARGSAIDVTVSASVAPGWRVYAPAQFASGPEGLMFAVGTSPIFAMSGEVKRPQATVKFDPNFGKDVAVYEDRAEFGMRVAVAAAAKPGPHTVAVDVTYQTCNAVICLPPKTETLKIPVTVK